MGLTAFFLVVILSILEVTLSFDNAVVNARVLKRMSPIWQRRFLTWGILIAVFGTRFILPIIIVSVAVLASPVYITKLAFTNPEEYGRLLEGVHASITAFGGIFLLMVSLKFFFDKAKSVHWIRVVEEHLVRWGNIEAIEVAIALSLLLTMSFLTHYDQASVLIAGIVGLVLFIIMEGVAGSLSIEGKDIAIGGATLFIYLNILDSAFSLDGVIGAFALTSNLVIIMVGLGIGAFFVRSFTLYMVQKNTLAELVYLEHGAHWAILGLSTMMLANLLVHVPEVIIGLIGLCFVLLSYYSSISERKRKMHN
ncbi:MAG: Integral membrane protein TerC family protein [Parcubacteria bacterium OLB19]|nr:MAG: Integral membrane protein TerC family protein [Parcubacteria bacterium OLB19]